MAGYSTTDTLKTKISEKQLIQLTDDAQLGTIDTTVFDQENANVRNLIDGYLRGRYPLPLVTVPGELVDLSDRILVCALTKLRFRNDTPDSITSEMKACIDQLKDIQKGVFILDINTTTDTPAAGGYATNKTADDRMFPKSELDKY